MKKIITWICTITLVMIISILDVSATTYYVKSSGNDAAAGTSDGTAWATITKVNTVWAAGTFAPGDQILFNRGDVFYGTLTPTESGTGGSVITVGAYGSGVDPIITGFTTITGGWTSDGGNIYHISSSGQSTPRLVVIDTVNTAMGRYPDAGNYNTFESSSGVSSITDNQLSASPSWTGAEVVLRTYDWVVHAGAITNHSGTSIFYTNGASNYPPTESGYFIQKSLSTLTSNNEWYHSGINLYIYSTVNPSAKVIKTPSLNYVVSMSGISYITFMGINFQGANIAVFNLTNSPHITINNCTIRYSANYGINVVDSGASTYLEVTSSSIADCNNIGIYIGGSSHSYANISGNDMRRIGHLLGMGGNYDVSYCGISTDSPYGMIELNTFKDIGFNVIEYWEHASYTTIQYNFIDTYGYNKCDGGAIYTWKSNGGYNQVGCFIASNIILNGIGAYTFGSSVHQMYGIYMDGRSANNTISYNTIANVESSGIYINSSHDHVITNNTVLGSITSGACATFNENYNDEGNITNIVFTDNILIGIRDTEVNPWPSIMGLRTTNSIMSDFFTTCNNNRYVNPNYPSTDAYMYYEASSSYNHVTLSQWKLDLVIDANSTGTPLSTPLAGYDDNYIHLCYNNSPTDKYFTLSTTMKDAIGNNYSGVVTVDPYQSVILLGAGTVTEEVGIDATVPDVTTSSIIHIGSTSATGGGNVTDDRGATVTARGVCWAVTANPTTANSKTTNGTGTGAYSSNITGLVKNTLYHVRAYATNSEGTSYGADVTFTTANNLIVVW